MSATLEQSLDAAFLNRGLVAVKGVARHAHDLAGLRHVAQFLGQIQQSSFVFDDLVGSIQHRGLYERLPGRKDRFCAAGRQIAVLYPAFECEASCSLALMGSADPRLISYRGLLALTTMQA